MPCHNSNAVSAIRSCNAMQEALNALVFEETKSAICNIGAL